MKKKNIIFVIWRHCLRPLIMGKKSSLFLKYIFKRDFERYIFEEYFFQYIFEKNI